MDKAIRNTTYPKIFGVRDLVKKFQHLTPIGADISPAVGVSACELLTDDHCTKSKHCTVHWCLGRDCKHEVCNKTDCGGLPEYSR